MSGRLEGRSALVTGAAAGIGRAIAEAFAAEGADVAILDRDAGRLGEVERELGGQGRKIVSIACDLTDAAAAREAVDQAIHGLDKVDVLVNNAGMQHVAPVESFPPEKWDAIIALNLSAAFHTSRLAVPHMKAKGWGRIICTASAHSLAASPFKAAYVAAKHGIAGLTKVLALELAEHGITANCISPGYVWTPLVENQIPDTMAARGMTREQVVSEVLLAKQPTRKFVQPEEVAALAVFLCRDEAQNINGANYSIDGGWTAE